jgi:ABC-type methionine transport system permease subunit
VAADALEELRGEVVALETALAAAFGEIAVLRAAIEGGGSPAALGAMAQMAAQLEASVLRGVIGAEALGHQAAAAGFERRMEQIVHALRNAVSFREAPS